MFGKVLIANRGEIALRVIRSCRERGLRTVAVHSEIDTEALHTRLADEAICIGPDDPRRSYLHIPAIIAAAEITRADAVHPGYGFLSESPEFAETCEQCGLKFIGPTPEQMRQWGDKVTSRAMATSLGLPVIEGTELAGETGNTLPLDQPSDTDDRIGQSVPVFDRKSLYKMPSHLKQQNPRNYVSPQLRTL